MRNFYLTILLILVAPFLLWAQPKYRTFTQEQLSQAQDRNAGRSIASRVSYVIKNTFDSPKNELAVHFSAPILALEDTGGFPYVKFYNTNSTIIARGKTLLPGDSVVLHALVKRKTAGTKITGWQMRMREELQSRASLLMPGSAIITMSIEAGVFSKAVLARSDQQVVAPPTGGNIRDYLYQMEVKKPAGIVMGIPKAPGNVGWVRSIRSDVKSFQQTGKPRCFDTLLNSANKKKPFIGEQKNPSLRVYNNHLLGSLHALKFSMLSNDSSVTEPYDVDATPFRLLVYYDSANAADRFNNYTIEQISKIADSALTFCHLYPASIYEELDQTINKILDAFAGPIDVPVMRPMKVIGVRTLAEVPFLHENPAALPNIPRRKSDTALETTPVQNGLLSNYPNPFNPTTTLSFSLNGNSTVSLKIFNLLGQEISALLDHSELEKGEHFIEFDAANLPSGTYYYRLLAKNLQTGRIFTDVKKMTLMR